MKNGFMYIITSQPFNPRIKPWYDFGLGKTFIPFSSIFSYDDIFQTPSLITITSLNLRRPVVGQKKIIALINQQTRVLYVSERHIYLTSGQTQTKIKKIYIQTTTIKPFADGKVPGSITNQFFLDESGQYLRIATTSKSSDGTIQNNIFVLNYYLKPYGQLKGIAPGEEIYSARYVGTRCYLAAFSQNNPFIVISIRNHRRPVLLGQIETNGYSRYLHPYDQTTVIGLGRQTSSTGNLGLKISVYDLTDVSNPVENNYQIQEKYARSIAEFEHKAFLFSPDSNLLVIPTKMNYNGIKFNGAFVFSITPTSIRLQNLIDHLLRPTDNFQNRSVERSVEFRNLIYTKSKCLLRINRNSQLFQGVKDVKIPCDDI